METGVILFITLVLFMMASAMMINESQKRRSYKERHYLYRVKCERHAQITIMETAYYPDLGEFYCVLCSWRAEGNLLIEKRAINYFSNWERVE